MGRLRTSAVADNAEESSRSGSSVSTSSSASGEDARWTELLSSDDSSVPHAMKDVLSERRSRFSRASLQQSKHRRPRAKQPSRTSSQQQSKQRRASAELHRSRSSKAKSKAESKAKNRAEQIEQSQEQSGKKEIRAATANPGVTADGADADGHKGADSPVTANPGTTADGADADGHKGADSPVTATKTRRRSTARAELEAELEAEQETWGGLSELVLNWQPELQQIDLSGQWIGDLGAEQIASELARHLSLMTLDLGANDIRTAGAERLAEALASNASLVDLLLKGNSLGDAGTRCIARALEVNSSLKKLDLSMNRVGDLGAEELALVLKINAVLLDLNLASNQVTNQGAYMLTGALQGNSTLSCLDISRNKIREEGAERLLLAVQNNNESQLMLKLTPNAFGHDLVNLAAVKDNRNRSQEFTVIADTGVDNLGFVLCNMPPGYVYLKEVRWASWAHNKGMRAGNRVVAVNGVDLVSMNAKAFRVQLRRRPLSLQVEPSQGGAAAAGAREALAQEVVATVKDKKLGMIFLNAPPGPVFVDKVEDWSWAANMGVQNGTTIVAIEGEDTLTLSAEAFKTMLQKRPLRLTILAPQPGLSPVHAWRERLAEAPMRDTLVGELSHEEQQRRQQREQERFKLRAEADSRRIAAEAAKRTREEMIAAEDRRLRAQRKGPLRLGDESTLASPCSPGGLTADHSDDGKSSCRPVVPADMVDVQLSMLGKVKLVRHARVTTISLLLAPHERNAGGPLVAKDTYGLELGPEITLGQLAEMRNEGGPLELSLECDLWSPARS